MYVSQNSKLITYQIGKNTFYSDICNTQKLKKNTLSLLCNSLVKDSKILNLQLLVGG